jgi:hypothetical protein
MKLKKEYAKTRKDHVTPQLASMNRNYADEPAVNHPLWPLFCLITETMDEAAVSENTCLILGTTKTRNAYSVTIRIQGETVTVYGVDPVELMAAVDEVYTAG